jgi:hypothetical protein
MKKGLEILSQMPWAQEVPGPNPGAPTNLRPMHIGRYENGPADHRRAVSLFCATDVQRIPQTPPPLPAC